MRTRSGSLAFALLLLASCGGDGPTHKTGGDDAGDNSTGGGSGGSVGSGGSTGGGGSVGTGGSSGGSTGSAGSSGSAGRGGTAGSSGGGMDAGVAGRGGSGGTPAVGDAGAPAGNANCMTLHYCEDFEKYAVGSQPGAPWRSSVGGGATLMVDSTKPFGGTKSVHITAPAGATSHGTMAQQMGAAVPITSNNLFGRVMIFWNNQNGTNLPTGVHSWIFNVSGKSAVSGTVSMNMGGGAPRFQLNYQWSGMEASKQGGMWTAGKWLCVQWQYDSSGTPPKNEARVWVDGQPALNVAGTVGWNFATPWSAMSLGFEHYQTLANPIEVWLDDFALSDSMVACPAPK